MGIATKSVVSNARLSGSTCTRCGKPRIVIDTYEEKVEKSTVVYTITACSDPECQKIVDKSLSEEKRKRLIIKDEQERREVLRKETIALKRSATSI